MLAAIANTLSNCFKIPELKSRIVFTLIVLAICRVASMIPIPGLDGAALADFFEKTAVHEGGFQVCKAVVVELRVSALGAPVFF
jgi:preprotein translocase subunit SecY